MELSARKRAVLAAIVRTYIETGEPVGSKILTELIENAPSSATLRNEMSELCELGLLEQPHTSAGRIPTSNAYRLYVNKLMKPSAVSESTRGYIDNVFSSLACDPELIHRHAANMLSELTGFPAVSYYLVGNDVTVKRIELLPVGGRLAMLLLVTSDGRARNRICRLGPEFSRELRDQLREIFDTRIRRKPLSELNRAYLQNVIASSGFNSFALMPLLTEVFEMAADTAETPVCISGTTSLHNLFGEDRTRRILSLAERSDPFIQIFEPTPKDTEVIFGNDTGFPELGAATMIVCKYNSGNRYCGRIGIIGSDRMSYEQIIPSIEYTASRLTALMTEVQKDMED